MPIGSSALGNHVGWSAAPSIEEVLKNIINVAVLPPLNSNTHTHKHIHTHTNPWVVICWLLTQASLSWLVVFMCAAHLCSMCTNFGNSLTNFVNSSYSHRICKGASARYANTMYVKWKIGPCLPLIFCKIMWKYTCLAGISVGFWIFAGDVVKIENALNFGS